MKKLFVLVTIAALLAVAGYASAHDTYWKNWDHMKFSLGFTKCDAATIKQSNEEGWWGTEVPCGEQTATAVGPTWECPGPHDILIRNQETGEWECVYDGADDREAAPSPEPDKSPDCGQTDVTGASPE